jgi:hypothetical protein
MEVSGQIHAPGVKRPGSLHLWVEGWEVLRASLDAEAKGQSFNPSGDRTQVFQPVTCYHTDWAPGRYSITN